MKVSRVNQGFDDVDFPSVLVQDEIEFPKKIEQALNELDLELPPAEQLLGQLQRKKNKPTLIKPTETIERVGEMVYDPITKSWRGNEQVLDAFEKPGVKPKLIQPTQQLDRVGDMIFDPVKMCWMGNDEEAHLFDDIEPLTASPRAPVKSAFGLSKTLEQQFAISESSHKLFMGSWYPRVVHHKLPRDTSKTFLYEVRHLKC